MTTPFPRYRLLDRHRVSTASLDQQLPDEHPVRTLWLFTSALDFAFFDDAVKAVTGRPGKPPYPPQLLFTLWLFALIDGVTSARELARRCHRDLPYQWLCGGHRPDYHTLSDFHGQNGPWLRQLFIDHIAGLRAQGLSELERVTLDGTKKPGQAGHATHHREATLQRPLAEAEEHYRQWEAGRIAPEALSAQQRAARKRAARERAERLRRAVAQVQQLQTQRAACKRTTARPEEARANEADPDATRMKQGDGGFRIGYNVQTVTDTASGLVVTTEVITQGNDHGQLLVQLDRLETEQGTKPKEILLDSGYATLADIDQATTAAVVVVMPLPYEKTDRKAGRDPFAAKRDDSPAVRAWRSRMGQPWAQALYQIRCGVAELIHARMDQRKWKRFRLRGLAKANTEAVWQALVHNVSRLLAWNQLGTGGTVRAAG